MRIRTKVGPAIVTIHHGDTCLVTGLNGEITPTAQLGLFCKDTRFVSLYRHLISGRPWNFATSTVENPCNVRFCFVSPEIETRSCVIEAASLEMRLRRTMGEDLVEAMQIANYAREAISFHLEIQIESDFADVFDVKECRIMDRGEIEVSWNRARHELKTHYVNGPFQRSLSYRITCKDGAPQYANGRIRFHIELAPKQVWRADARIVPIVSKAGVKAAAAPHEKRNRRTQKQKMDWSASTTSVECENEDVQHAFDQAIADIGALRLYEHDIDDTLWIPAAGVPWFVTLFGRDSLITSFESLLVTTKLAKGTLKRLAEMQAKTRDDWRDAQPGKIVHEIRSGELAVLNVVPHAHYYGTADATLLYLILLSEVYRWTGGESLLREHRETAERCLEWMDRYGDLDGDGFQEYRTFSPQGYHNMGWKDAGDAVVYPDGSQVEQPIATCELQGYAYDAKIRMAEAFEILGAKETSRQLSDEANKLKARFNEAFWIEEDGTFAFALDPEKNSVGSVASNAGHLLWSGIVEGQTRARKVMERLLRPDMFSGWGVRTLSAGNPAYNPHSYQRGSVWPHDNAIIAAGAKRYGLVREANQIMRSVFEACFAFEGYQLPELFAGVEREIGIPPVQYIGTNIPQAWASASIFLMLQSMLGISADARHNRLIVNPTLPQWLGQVQISRLRVGQANMTLRFTGSGADSACEILDNPENIEVAKR